MKSPLLGYNTNVRHHGKTFHIQTEDSGSSHGHIFTHLFADGGRIVATKKTTYAQWVGTERYPGIVKKLMQAQHKAMFIALRDGLFDTDEIAGAKEFATREIVLDESPAKGSSSGTLANPASSSSGTLASPASSSSGTLASPASAAPSSASSVLGSSGATHAAPELDVDALERAAAALSTPLSDVPRPPNHGSAAPIRPSAVPKRLSASPSHARLDPTPVAAISTAPRASSAAPSSMYQQTQPVASRPRAPKQNESLFGADILSEKSLDEVIMSYLADDLDEKE